MKSWKLTDCRQNGGTNDSFVLLPITAAVYQNGKEKPAMRWSFELGIWGESDKLFDFIIPL